MTMMINYDNDTSVGWWKKDYNQISNGKYSGKQKFARKMAVF
jgi:hypothetical protein